MKEWVVFWIGLLGAVAIVNADFAYTAFGPSTIGLHTVGSCVYSSCPELLTPQTVIVNTIETSDTLTVSYLTTERGRNHTTSQIAAVNNPCTPALRLTVANPIPQAGAVWHTSKQAVVSGFDTTIEFRIWAQSVLCEVCVSKDERRTLQYNTCVFDSAEQNPIASGVGGTHRYDARGGDSLSSDMFVGQHTKALPNGGHGFAVVIQNAATGLNSIGSNGAGLGYSGGVPNSIAVLFDTVSEFSTHDRWTACIRVVYTTGTGTQYTLSDSVCAPLAIPGVSTHSDGSPAGQWPQGCEAHQLRVVLWPTQRDDLSQSLRPSPALAPLLVGSTNPQTLCVHLDSLSDGEPLLCIPADITRWLSLLGGKAFIGLTASTGQVWANHDISAWKFCQIAGMC